MPLSTVRPINVTRWNFEDIVSTSFLFLVVRPLFLVAMPFAPSSVLCFLMLVSRVAKKRLLEDWEDRPVEA